jgi:LmbE family N-acetylglucosaminyl deacetylase
MTNQPRLRRAFGGTGHLNRDANVVERSGSLLVERYLACGRALDEMTPPVGRTVVVVPHPDDEALAAGGLIARQRGRGREVVVVAVTDGDAAYPDWRGAELARVRRREQLDALRRLGVRRQAVYRLGITDGAVAGHLDAIVTGLLEVLSPDDTLVAPAVFDWHPDHEACGRAARTAADLVGCTLLGSLFWAHHHPDHVPANVSLCALALSDDEVARRRAAVLAHRSQLAPSPCTSADPILAPELLGLLDRPVEYYVASPARRANHGGGT